MKRIILALALTAASISTILAFRPKTDYQPSYLEVMDVETCDTCTRVTIALKHLPNYWVQLDALEKHYLIADGDTTKKYRGIGAENLEFEKHIYMQESGRHEGVLIFEKIPEGTKVLDYVAEENKPTDNFYGIHLDEEEPEHPAMIDPKTLLNTKSAERWTGLDPDRYPDIPFLTDGGSTHIRGKINNYSTLCDFSTLKISTYNNITGREDVNLGEINPDGTFAFDVKTDHPQFSYLIMGDSGKEVFLMPGDTLDIVTTTLTDYTNPGNGYLKYFGFTGEIDDATIVNTLSDVIKSECGLDNIFKDYFAGRADSIEDAIYANNEKLSRVLDTTIAKLPELLGDIEASTFAKDMLAAHTIGLIADLEETNEMYFRHKNQPRMHVDSTGNISVDEFRTLDLKRLFEPRKQHNRLIYSNPIMLCANNTLQNRWQYNDLFFASTGAADGTLNPHLMKKIDELMSDDELKSLADLQDFDWLRLLKLIDADNERQTGVGNCFAAQLSRVHSLVADKGVFFTPTRESLQKIGRQTSMLSSLVDYPSLNKALYDTYASLAEEVALSETEATPKSDFSMVNADKNADVLAELIKPYLGNLIFIDFWGLGCGPCRTGMINQKRILEKFAGKPFKVLYVADDSNVEGCNRFLDKEGIKGEHIYVSTDNWNRLSAYFNFTGIPFGVLIGKNGELLKTHFYLDDTYGSKEIERHLSDEQ